MKYKLRKHYYMWQVIQENPEGEVVEVKAAVSDKRLAEKLLKEFNQKATDMPELEDGLD